MRTDECKVLYARVAPELHAAAVEAARRRGEPLGLLVERAVRRELERGLPSADARRVAAAG